MLKSDFVLRIEDTQDELCGGINDVDSYVMIMSLQARQCLRDIAGSFNIVSKR